MESGEGKPRPSRTRAAWTACARCGAVVPHYTSRDWYLRHTPEACDTELAKRVLDS